MSSRLHIAYLQGARAAKLAALTAMKQPTALAPPKPPNPMTQGARPGWTGTAPLGGPQLSPGAPSPATSPRVPSPTNSAGEIRPAVPPLKAG